MLGGNSKEDDVLAKEALKIAARRRFDAERTARIHNAKQRLIGLPIQGLDAQVAERQQRNMHDRDVLNYESKTVYHRYLVCPSICKVFDHYFTGAQALEIERILAASMEEERRMKEFQMDQMKRSWAESAARKREEQDKPRVPDYDPDNAGPASLQAMKGEDIDRAERIKAQKEQMRLWVQDQIAQKAYVKQLDQEDNLNYADMIKAIDEIREATEQEEAEMRKYVINTVKADNLEVCFVFSSSTLLLHHLTDVFTPSPPSLPSSRWARSNEGTCRTPSTAKTTKLSRRH